MDLEYPLSVSEVAWEWQAPDGGGWLLSKPIPVGVAVFYGDGVTVLAGDSGEELWAYRVPGSEILGNVSDDQRFVVLTLANEGEDNVEMLILDSGTGKILHRYNLSEISRSVVGEGSSNYHLRSALSSVTESAWFTADQSGEVTAREFSTDEKLWSVEVTANCPQDESVDDIFAWDKVILLAVTCFPGTEAKSGVSADFVSALIGIDPSDGVELWREEVFFSDHPESSFDREFTARHDGMVLARYSHFDSGQVIDAFKGESLITDGREIPIWVSDDGSEIGLWDRRVENYWIKDHDGRIKRQLNGRGESVVRPILADPGIGLRQGILLTDRVFLEDGELALFEGFDHSVSIPSDRVVAWSSGHLAPGSVVVTYNSNNDERFAVGLR
ncbi:hypothetical protein GCM10009642_34020 [Nocardiopsis metallicus]